MVGLHLFVVVTINDAAPICGFGTYRARQPRRRGHILCFSYRSVVVAVNSSRV